MAVAGWNTAAFLIDWSFSVPPRVSEGAGKVGALSYSSRYHPYLLYA
jgi:hypothetical protein